MNARNYIKEYFPALSHRNFKLFWTGQIISLVGTWMQNAALSWLVYTVTKDRFKLGLMTAVQFTPLFLFSLFAGILVEKYPKRKIIILTQSLQLVTAFILFLFVYFNRIQFGYILVLVFCIGTVQAIDNPARQSFVVEMVEGKSNLLNAIALNSAAFNAARLVGPAVAGAVMANFGPKWCFFLNAVSFIAVIIGLFMMRMQDVPTRKEVGKPIEDIKEGLRYIIKTPKLLHTFISIVIIPTFCINFNVLIPIYTKDTLGLSEKAFGILLSSLGLGALISAISVAARGNKDKTVKYQIFGALGLSIFLLLLGATSHYGLAILNLAVCGFFMIMFSTTSNSILQLNSPDHLRGRIMSVYSLVFGGFTPIGSLFAGSMAKYFGPQIAFVASGFIGLFGFTLLYLRRRELS